MNEENIYYTVFDYSQVYLVNFDEVLETSINTLRLSLNGTKTTVKWEGDVIPASVNLLTTKTGIYNHEEILKIMSSPEWSNPNLS